jgi:hypothetical protein
MAALRTRGDAGLAERGRAGEALVCGLLRAAAAMPVESARPVMDGCLSRFSARVRPRGPDPFPPGTAAGGRSSGLA